LKLAPVSRAALQMRTVSAPTAASGVHRAVRAEDRKANRTASSTAVRLASMATAAGALIDGAGAVTAPLTSAAPGPHSPTKSAVAASAPSAWLTMYAPRSWRCTRPRSQKPSVTAGLRCAPLRRPSGETATSAARTPNVSPMIAKRTSAEPTRTADERSDTSATTEKPRNSCSAVPASSAAHSATCRSLRALTPAPAPPTRTAR
jgi:hypothetical protein